MKIQRHLVKRLIKKEETIVEAELKILLNYPRKATTVKLKQNDPNITALVNL